MCGRYTLTSKQESIARQYLVELTKELEAGLKPRYNISPGTGVMVIRDNADKGRREADFFHWGLIPAWMKESELGRGWINARSETVTQKPAFRDAIRYRRCLIPANGFYEWEQKDSGKWPYYLQSPAQPLLSFAGIWEHWMGVDGSEMLSCAILTTRANKDCRGIHDRMPVLLNADHYDLWLDPDIQDASKVTDLLKPAPNGTLECYPVSQLVNSNRNDSADLMAPVEKPPRWEQTNLF
jgi:putative SOS response-associated peptidase YedK